MPSENLFALQENRLPRHCDRRFSVELSGCDSLVWNEHFVDVQFLATNKLRCHQLASNAMSDAR